MFSKIDNLIIQVEGASVLNPNEPVLMQALSALYLAKEMEQLRSSLERITAASDAIPGGFAIRTTRV